MPLTSRAGLRGLLQLNWNQQNRIWVQIEYLHQAQKKSKMGMRVLVTGGTGFLGTSIVKALLKNEGVYEVRLLVRSIERCGDDVPPQVELIQGDVLDVQSLIRACDGCEAVLHVAALVCSWIPQPSLFFQVNVGGLQNLLEAVKCSKSITKIIYTSSFFALGPTDGHVGDENQEHTGSGFCTEYEKSKVEADKVARKAVSDGFPIILLYPGVIYGSGKLTKGNIVAEILIERFNGRLPGYIGRGSDRFSFCNVDDVADGHVAALEKGVIGCRYILGGENASFVEVFDMVAEITKTRRPWFHIPMLLVYLYGLAYVGLAKLTGIQPVITHPAAVVLMHEWSYSSEKAALELGYKPRSLSQGLPQLLYYLKDKHLIHY